MKNLIFAFLFFATPATAQNIVRNSNFAVRTSCPSQLSQLDKSTFWYAPTKATPDYYNRCDTTVRRMVWVPRNTFGYQKSFSNAYAGAYSFIDNGYSYREYIATTVPSLSVGGTYRVTIVVSLSESSTYAVDGLGVLFFENYTLDSIGHTSTISKIPQIDYSTYGTIRDTANWVTLSKTFVADSAYTHLVIGNFKHDSVMHIDTVGIPRSIGWAYYYFDSVAVQEVEQTFIENINSNISVIESPNPFSDHCTIRLDGKVIGDIELILTDYIGKVVRKEQWPATHEIVVERRELPVGCYFYTIRNQHFAIHKGKLVIR